MKRFPHHRALYAGLQLLFLFGLLATMWTSAVPMPFTQATDPPPDFVPTAASGPVPFDAWVLIPSSAPRPIVFAPAPHRGKRNARPIAPLDPASQMIPLCRSLLMVLLLRAGISPNPGPSLSFEETPLERKGHRSVNAVVSAMSAESLVSYLVKDNSGGCFRGIFCRQANDQHGNSRLMDKDGGATAKVDDVKDFWDPLCVDASVTPFSPPSESPLTAACFVKMKAGSTVIVTTKLSGRFVHIPAVLRKVTPTGSEVLLKHGPRGTIISLPSANFPVHRVLMTAPVAELRRSELVNQPAAAGSERAGSNGSTPFTSSSGAKLRGGNLIFSNKIQQMDSMGLTLMIRGRICDTTMTLFEVDQVAGSFVVQTCQGELWRWPEELEILEVRRINTSPIQRQTEYPQPLGDDLVRAASQHGYLQAPTRRYVFDFLHAVARSAPHLCDVQGFVRGVDGGSTARVKVQALAPESFSLTVVQGTLGSAPVIPFPNDDLILVDLRVVANATPPPTAQLPQPAPANDQCDNASPAISAHRTLQSQVTSAPSVEEIFHVVMMDTSASDFKARLLGPDGRPREALLRISTLDPGYLVNWQEINESGAYIGEPFAWPMSGVIYELALRFPMAQGVPPPARPAAPQSSIAAATQQRRATTRHGTMTAPPNQPAQGTTSADDTPNVPPPNRAPAPRRALFTSASLGGILAPLPPPTDPMTPLSTSSTSVFVPSNFPRPTEKAALLPERLTIPKVSYLPSHLKVAFRERVSEVIKGFRAMEPSVKEERLSILLMCPEKLLAQSKTRMANRTLPAFANPSDIPNIPPPAARKEGPTTCPEKRLLNAAVSLAVQGHLGRAVKALTRENTERPEEAQAVELLRALHPCRAEHVESLPMQMPIEVKCPTTTVRPSKKYGAAPMPRLQHFVHRMCDGKTAGVSGWTEELVRDSICADNEADWLAIFEDIANANFGPENRRRLRRSILISIPKKPAGIRPLAMGEVFVKIAAKLVLGEDKELFGAKAVGDFQFAFTRGGTEFIVHATRALLQDPNMHVILVDSSNAFNTIRRWVIRRQLETISLLYQLRGLFNLLYVDPGELLYRSDQPDCPVVTSTEGVRQGDVMGPLLFCIGLKPAIDKVQARFHHAHPTKTVRFFAYMDDITIVGDESSCAVAFNMLCEELGEIGLTVNKAKTVTTSQVISNAIGCELNDCPKLLGAFVSRNVEREKANIDLLPAKHDLMFDRIAMLPPEVAYHLLIRCGVPRWAHLIRTHQPEVTKEASTVFTEKSVRCLAAILKMDYSAIDEEVYRQMRLPVRHGGLGLHDWSERCEDAYEASTQGQSRRDVENDPNAPDEAVREDSFWIETLAHIKRTNEDFHKHLQSVSNKIACGFLQSPITAASAQAANSFRGAVLHHLRFAGKTPLAPTPFKCVCNFPADPTTTTTRDVMHHILGCVVHGGVTRRHHMVKNYLHDLMSHAGYEVVPEHPLANTDGLIMDLVVTPPDGGLVYIDVTVVNPKMTEDASKRLAEADKKKRATYEAVAKRDNATLITFALTTRGVKNQQAVDLLATITSFLRRRFADQPDSPTSLLNTTYSSLSKVLAMGNGLCLVRSQKLPKVSVFLHRTSLSFFSPPPLALGEGDNADNSASARVGADGAAASVGGGV